MFTFRSLVATAAVLVAAHAQAAELRMLSAYPEGFIYTREITHPFIDAVARETGGKVEIKLAGPEAVPPLEQLEPVQSGAFDLLITHPAYHAGTTSLGIAIDAVRADPAARRESGVIDFLDKHYQKIGLKLISAVPLGTHGFRYFLREPITGAPSFAARKIRGTVSYFPMIEALGGSGVIMGGGDVYSALQTGVVDGAAWSLTGALDFKWYEVAGYLADPVFGQVGVMVLMNLDTWEGLDDADRQTIETLARNIELESVVKFDRLADEEKDALLAKGMKITEFPEADATRLDMLWSEGVWQVASKTAADEAKALRALASGAGLADPSAD